MPPAETNDQASTHAYPLIEKLSRPILAKIEAQPERYVFATQ